MSETKVRIASNPYTEHVGFYLQDGPDWKEVTTSTSPNSALSPKENAAIC